MGTEIDFASFTFLLFGLVLIFMMLFRREGLLPESRLKLVLHEEDLDEDSDGKKAKR
jgi:branched-chain amino acid transport system permease protein